jgi:hypothetical protein
MDGTSETHAPFRDARYAPRALEVERRGDVLILRNPTPYSRTVQTVTAPLVRWASQTPHRVWLAEAAGGRGRGGWRTVTYAEAADQVDAPGRRPGGTGPVARQAAADPGPQRHRPRPDRLCRHEPGRADRAGLAAVRPEGRGPLAPGLRGRTAEAGGGLCRRRRDLRRRPGRAVPGGPAGGGRPQRPRRRHGVRDAAGLRAPASGLPARRRGQAAADLGLDRPAQGGDLHPRQHRPERRPDRRLLRRPRPAGAGQFRAVEPQPGGQRHPAHGAAPGRDFVHRRWPAAGWRPVRRDGAKPAGSVADLSQHGPGRLGPAGRRAGARRGPGGQVLREGAGAAIWRGVDGPVDPRPGPGRGPADDRLPGDLRGGLRRHRDRPDRLQHPLAERPLGHDRPAHARHGGQAGPGPRRSRRTSSRSA